MESRTPKVGLVVVFLVLGTLAIPRGTPAQVSDAALFDFSADGQGWILQYVGRTDGLSGIEAVRPYAPFVPEGWDDATRYPWAPGGDPVGDGSGAFAVGLHLEGVDDAGDPAHAWLDAVYVQSEDRYTHEQSGWPAGYEQHLDYTGSWPFGHHGSIGAVAGDALRLRVYNPGFSHPEDPVQGWLYARSGAGEVWSDGGMQRLAHGWSVLALDLAALADPGDLREIGIKLGGERSISGTMYVDAVSVGAAGLEGDRFIYLSPDVVWFSEQPDYDTGAVQVIYDDGGGLSPGVRGAHLLIRFPPECVQVLSVAPGTLLAGEENHFESLIDNAAGWAIADWVILGATPGAGGSGTLAEFTFAVAAGQETHDCCVSLDLDEVECQLRDPDNAPLAAVYVDGQASHDITPPLAPVLTSSSHAEGSTSANNDYRADWLTVNDRGTCPVGMRGFYLILDHDHGGAPDPRGGSYDWFTPWSPDSAAYRHWFQDVPDGEWYFHIVACDWLWNCSAVTTHGPFTIDTTRPANVTSFEAEITANVDLSVDLSWVNPSEDFAGVRIYRLGFGNYPEYDDPPGAGSAPAWPSSPSEAIAAGWQEVYDGTGTEHVDHPAVRDYYYYTAFTYDAVDNNSWAHPEAHDASLCYWLGDFTVGGLYVVDIYDVLVLSLAYGMSEGDPDYNNVCDIGPTTDYGRKSRPTTDNVIQFEDLIMLALNYNAQAGKRDGPDPGSCSGSLLASADVQRNGRQVEVTVRLRDNPGCLVGASVELAYGAALEWVGATEGEFWSGLESTFLVARDESRARIALDAVALGGSTAAGGIHAVARFRLRDAGSDPAVGTFEPGLGATDVVISGFEARGIGNVDLAGSWDPQGLGEPNRSACGSLNVRVEPNPTSGRAQITFTLPEAQRVRIDVFDTAGRWVERLHEGPLPPGVHRVSWDGRRAGSRFVEPGVYFYRLQTGEHEQTHRLMVVR
ncbi:MAG: T9SS type A sorting domain-containing protein [Candidatus Eisenbacteria sp.]|nr:T9SS type A sorting domain-containing protein [Candidatus Eisenbacteria bacterium]